jgi:hypothetical protein
MDQTSVADFKDEQTGLTMISGALALIQMPFTFIQDDLLNTDGFLRAARERGHDLALDDLQDLHARRLLVPLYRVSATLVAGRRLHVTINGNLDCRMWALHAAQEGRLYDSAQEGYNAAWPYTRPADESDRQWWNGFLYSSWQLLDVHRALNERTILRHLQHHVQHNTPPNELARRHERILALAVLAPCYLPDILGQLSVPGGIDGEALVHFCLNADVVALLRAVGYPLHRLQDDAEQLLIWAGRDPLRDWLPLVRHANLDAWKKLHDEPLDCLWLRIGAEVLLRAHEDLAAEGQLPALPDVSGAMYVPPLHGRLGRKNDSPRPLEQVLGNFGLSPHPRVLLVIEGKTERFHVRPLLEQFGLGRPEQVRVQQCKGSLVNPQLLARYAVTPRVGKKLGDAWQLAATPTALVIAMDPENRWATPARCEDERRKIKEAIREEVELQDGQIDNATLDFNVNVYTWGDDKYELANFTDDELIPALTQLAKGADVGAAGWTVETRQKLQAARRSHRDIEVVTGPLRVNKIDLAKLLWPTLAEKCERELAADDVKTPVLKVILKVRDLAARLSAGSYVLPPANGE